MSRLDEPPTFFEFGDFDKDEKTGIKKVKKMLHCWAQFGSLNF